MLAREASRALLAAAGGAGAEAGALAAAGCGAPVLPRTAAAASAAAGWQLQHAAGFASAPQQPKSKDVKAMVKAYVEVRPGRRRRALQLRLAV